MSRPPDLVPSLTTLSDIPGGWTERVVAIAGRTFGLWAPAAPDEFVAWSEPAGDEPPRWPDPYWAQVWPAAEQLAAAVLRAAALPGAEAKGRTLELGCGCGLAGLAAAARGHAVTFSDYVPEAVAAAVENARRNGWPAARGLQLDWRAPQAGEFAFVLAADVLYDPELHAPLLRTIDAVLAPAGVCWIGEPGRSAAERFPQAAREHGLRVELFDEADAPLAALPERRFCRLVLARAG